MKFFHREKMHNPYRRGTADYWYSGKHRDLWVEYKYLPNLPTRDNTFISADLSELQREWLNGRHTEGRNVWVIIGHPKGAVILQNQHWNDAITLAHFKEASISTQTLAQLLHMFCQGNDYDNSNIQPSRRIALKI